MRLTGSAALWFQTLPNRTTTMTWESSVSAVCNRFDKDEHNHLLRHFFHIKQTTTVIEYVEQLNDIVHHLLAHEPSFPPTVVTNRFIDGLMKDIRASVMMHRPQDLYTASALALLQEEANQDEPVKRFEPSNSSEKTSTDTMKHSGDSSKPHLKPTDDKKPTTSNLPKSGEDKVAALKNYRRCKGICFKCGKKWGPQHKFPATVSLNVMEQLWSCVTEGEELNFLANEVESDSNDELMALSV
jgi:hypothetical protein